MDVSEDVRLIVDKGLEGNGLAHDEMVRLCDLDEFSLDAHYVSWAARKLNGMLNDGVAEVHSQIGMDSNLCQRNCWFCSFAEVNRSRSQDNAVEFTQEEVVAYARAFAEAGANVVSLMTTANYDFEQYLDNLAAVREALGPDMPIMANIDDYTYDQALRLKAAGATSTYHGIRMGEGVVNEIPLDKRFDTLRAAKEAGLIVMTSLAMIDPRYSNDEVVDNMERIIALKPRAISAQGMVAVPGTKLCDDPHYTDVKYDLYGAVMRLSCGSDIRFCCKCVRSSANIGNIAWAEVGANPRDDVNKTEVSGLGQSVEKVRDEFHRMGWKTYKGPSKWW